MVHTQHRVHLSTQLGFTLMEVMVAMAVSAIVFGAGLMGFAELQRVVRHQSKVTYAGQEAKTLSELIVAETQEVGGDTVRPWSIVAVRDNYNAKADPPVADELHIAVINPNARDPIRAFVTSGTNKVWFYVADDSQSCASRFPAGTSSQIVLTAPNGFAWRNLEVLNILEPAQQRTFFFWTFYFCEVQVKTGVNYLADYPLGVAEGGPHTGTCPPRDKGANDCIPEASPISLSSDLSNGYVQLVETKHYYLEDQTLKADYIGWQGTNVGQYETVLAEGVLDFQVALGYDVRAGSGRDGRANMLPGSMAFADEWAYNSYYECGDYVGQTGDADCISADNFLADATPQDLRLASVGIVFGEKGMEISTRTTGTTGCYAQGSFAGVAARVLNGSAIQTSQEAMISTALSTAYLRNINVYR